MARFQRDAYLKDLEYLVNIDSKADDPEGVNRISDFLFEKYTALGLRVKKIFFGNSVGRCLEISNTDKDTTDCLLLGHMDTVFPKGTAKLRPFRTEDGVLRGPGVTDMKSGLLSICAVAKRLVEEDTEITFRIILNSHQEITSGLSKDWIAQMGRKSKVCYVFQSAREDGSLVHKRSGTARIAVRFDGTSAHAGQNPLEGRSAIHEMASFISDIVALNDYSVGALVNVGLVDGGIGANIVAKNACCEVDIRFNTLQDYMRLKALIEARALAASDRGVQAAREETAFCPPFHCGGKEEKIMEIVNRTAADHGLKIGWRETGSISDGNFVSAVGTPVIDGCGPVGGSVHSEDEYLLADSIEPRINFIYDVIQRVARSLDTSGAAGL